MATDLVIYGTEGSPFVRKVLVTLDEKGLPWTLEEVNVFDPPEWFVPLSPARRIPVLRDRTIATFREFLCHWIGDQRPPEMGWQ